MNQRVQLWSCGGGVQSTAIAALIVSGGLPKPDLAVIIDTERELGSTWDYLHQVTQPALAAVGVDLVRVPKSEYATVDLYSKKGDLLVPVFTDFSGEIGKLPTYCSNEWKQRAARRWASEQRPDAAEFSVWIGISTDEMKRLKQETGKWEPWYPLIHKRMNRSDSMSIVRNLGWPEPPRSSCWMCPNHTHDEWMRIKAHHPEDWVKAVEFEQQIRQKDDTMYLHPQGVPLSSVDFDQRNDDLFTGRCDSGLCFV